MSFFNHPIGRISVLPERQVVTPLLESDPLLAARTHFTLSVRREKAR